MASDPMPQQLITQSAQATADAIASALTARTASISLPIYDWNSQDAYHSFSIFCCTLENWLLLNCILPDSEDHLRYVFAALGTKSLEMHAQWMPTSSEEEQKVTKVKASAFLDHIQQGMTHDVNTHVHLGELEDIVARLGEDPQDLITCIKTLMDCCKMINDEHCKHELCCHIIHAYCHEGKLLGKLMAKPFKTPSSELAEHCCEPLCHPTCQGTSLPQLQTCGHNLPGQRADSPHQPQQPWSHTICTLQGLSQLHPTAPSWQSKLPSTWFPLFQMWQNGTLGTQMPWWQATPTKECTSTWVTAEEVQMPT